MTSRTKQHSEALHLRLSEHGAGPERLDEIGRGLRRELLQLDDVDTVDPVPGGPPPGGSRGLDVAAIGEWVVVVGSSLDVTRQVVAAVRSWLRRADTGSRVEVIAGDLKLVLDQAAPDQQAGLVDAFVRQLESRAEQPVATRLPVLDPPER